MDVYNSLNNYNVNSLEYKIANIALNEYSFFLEKTNVLGVGLGYKTINGMDTTNKCLKIFVSKKLSPMILSSSHLIPPLYEGIQTDVVDIGKVSTIPYNKVPLLNVANPVTGGYSIGPLNLGIAGTLGCLVKDDFDIYLLSNNHILANLNTLPIGTPIIQPATLDGGIPLYQIASLSKFIPLEFSNSFNSPENYVDCAIAKITNPNFVSSRITHIGTPRGVADGKLGSIVKKVGRTTGLTFGKIIALHVTQKVLSTNKSLTIFKDQMIATGMSEVGDSGSLLLNENNYAIGLLLSGNGSVSIFNPIKAVLSALDVSLMVNELN